MSMEGLPLFLMEKPIKRFIPFLGENSINYLPKKGSAWEWISISNINVWMLISEIRRSPSKLNKENPRCLRQQSSVPMVPIPHCECPCRSKSALITSRNTFLMDTKNWPFQLLQKVNSPWIRMRYIFGHVGNLCWLHCLIRINHLPVRSFCLLRAQKYASKRSMMIVIWNRYSKTISMMPINSCRSWNPSFLKIQLLPWSMWSVIHGYREQAYY